MTEEQIKRIKELREQWGSLIKEFPNLDPIQNYCMYGYILPDRCRYNSITGCDCGAYPPVRKQTDGS